MTKDKKLVIVESPTKIKTLKKFLDSSYIFESSLGHIIDLPKKGFGIDLEGSFDPEYAPLAEKKEVIEKLKKAAKTASTVFLCPDPDREGEAIAWHIASILPKKTHFVRAAFHSITKDAVREALAHPREIDMDLVHAQQTRRILDRIVGYKISPLLMRRVTRGGSALSAGRVQSVALKLVVDREKEIEAFKPVEYWRVEVQLKKDDRTFKAYLFSVDGKKVEKELVEGKDVFLVPNEKTAHSLLQRLESAKYVVDSVELKEKRRQPGAPFITSSLQMEASRHFGFSATRTMRLAQDLYEGVDLGNEGSEGLITYMRTDSVSLSAEAMNELRRIIPKELLNPEIRSFASRKSAQEAHEAIRPTNFNHPPESVKRFLSREQFQIYELIWKRTLASQMLPAVYDTVSADIETGKGLLFRATGSILKEPGFLSLYEEREDEEKEGEERLPLLEEGDPLKLVDKTAEQSFTKPPPRYTEASLIKELERLGIGRPSTYATIMNKIQSRDYTVKEQQRLKPTELGRVIAEFLEVNFHIIMNVGFTAEMEEDLERIAEHKKEWKKVVKAFWKEFEPILKHAEKEAFVPKITIDEPCPKCGAPVQKIWAKGRYFFGCSRYPDCDYTASEEEKSFNKDDYAPDFNWEQPCPICGGPTKVRHGRYGAFLGCMKYPECKGIINIPKKGEHSLGKCPAVGCPGKLMERKSRFGKMFIACSTYPECDVIGNTLEQINEQYKDHPRTRSVKKKFKLSAELEALVGPAKNRPELTKKMWIYIKANNLQDEKNRRMIVPDAALAKLIGSKEPFDMMQLARKLSSQIGG